MGESHSFPSDAHLPWRRVDSGVVRPYAAALMHHRRCPVCGAAGEHPALVLEEFQFFTDSAEHPKRVPIRVARCAHCFALYLNPCFSETGFRILFAEAGQSYGASEGRPAEQIAWLDARGLLAPGLSILDAGCYDGRFLSRLPPTLRRLGVDIDEPAIQRGRTEYGRCGIELICGDFERFVTPVSPDVITLFHVLEHLPNPVGVLAHLRRVSHARTRLVVEVPILENGLTNDINGFFSVQHMTHFSQRSLTNTLARSGWSILEWHQSEGYNGCRVVAEPGPAATTVMGDVEDMGLLQRYLAHWHANLAQVHERLSVLKFPRKAVIWGGGLHTEFLYQVTALFCSAPEREYLIVDSDASKQGRSWRGIPILAPTALASVAWDDCMLVISSYGSQDGMTQAALTCGVPKERIVQLYDYVARY